MGKNSYLGGHTLLGRHSSWFSFGSSKLTIEKEESDRIRRNNEEIFEKKRRRKAAKSKAKKKRRLLEKKAERKQNLAITKDPIREQAQRRLKQNKARSFEVVRKKK